MRVASNDGDDRARLRGYVNKSCCRRDVRNGRDLET